MPEFNPERAGHSEGGGNVPNANVLNDMKDRLEKQKAMSQLPRHQLPDKMNVTAFRKEALAFEKQVADASPISLSRTETEKLKQHVDKEIEWFKNNSLTQEELVSSANGNKLHFWEQKNGARAAALKNKLRTLDPENPMAGNLEQFRRKSGVSSFS